MAAISRKNASIPPSSGCAWCCLRFPGLLQDMSDHSRTILGQGLEYYTQRNRGRSSHPKTVHPALVLELRICRFYPGADLVFVFELQRLLLDAPLNHRDTDRRGTQHPCPNLSLRATTVFAPASVANFFVKIYLTIARCQL